MIPKIIHCCWFGGPKTRLARRCLASWRRFAPEWEVREFRLPSELPEFVEGAVKARKWAVVSDWARMKALYEDGGVYLDCDVELIRPFRPPEGEWVASEWKPYGGVWMNPGGGIALEKGSAVARRMLEAYARTEYDPARPMMPWINERLREAGALAALEPEVMSPIGPDGKMHRTEKTLGIHWYAMSGASLRQRVARWLSWHGLHGVVSKLKGLR